MIIFAIILMFTFIAFDKLLNPLWDKLILWARKYDEILKTNRLY